MISAFINARIDGIFVIEAVWWVSGESHRAIGGIIRYDYAIPCIYDIER